MRTNRRTGTHARRFLTFCAVLWIVGISAETALAGNTYYVTNTADSGPGSFRQAVLDANANPNPFPTSPDDWDFDFIEFDTSGVFATHQVISLWGFFEEELVTINGFLKINGPGADMLTISTRLQDSPVLIINGGFVTISGLKISEGGGLWGDDGGGIYVRGSLTMENCIVSGNSGTRGRGGAFYIASGGDLQLIDSIVSDNVAQEGGAIYSEPFTVISVENSEVSGNSATGDGGGIRAGENARINVINSIISGNISGAKGGGIYLAKRSRLTSTEGMYANNEAILGGGIYADSSEDAPHVDIESGSITGNQATDGGGIYNHALSRTTATGGLFRIDGTTINGNRAERGGGIYHLGGRPGIINDRIAFGGFLLITNSTISQNGGSLFDYDSTGGGIFQPGAFTTITNSTISSNQSGTGAAILGGYVKLNFCTITQNITWDYSNYSGALDTGDFILNSSIVAGNIGRDIKSDQYPGVSAESSLIQDSEVLSFIGTNNIIGMDPLLGPLADNGGPTMTHALLTGSPAIDAGGSVTVGHVFSLQQERLIYDQRGATHFRESGAGSDIGAFEVQVPDVTPPVITPTISGTLGDNGWYTSDVTISWSVVDGGSAISSQTGCENVTVTADTSGETSSCSAESEGGVTSQSVTIKRDSVKPTLNPVVTPNPVRQNDQATASANASDALSSLASESCETVSTANTGPQTLTCTAVDNAGNTASADAHYEVTSGFDFTGFFQPVDNLPVVNKAKAGQSIPLKFSLGGFQGMDIIAPGFPAASVIECDANEPSSTLDEASTAGNSGLTYDATADLYKYTWKTAKGAKGSCQMFVLKLIDGSSHVAQFRFE